MAQPYAGTDHGMHFPLHKGTEVLLTFIDGDPDRPIIQSAVPNPETQSPVNVNNQTMSAITTAGGNKIHIEDMAGSERILMHSPNQKSFVRIGAPNDPSITEDNNGEVGWMVQTGLAEATDGFIDVEAGLKCEIIIGEYTSWVLGGRLWFTFPFAVAAFVGGRWDGHFPKSWTLKNAKRELGVNEFEEALNEKRAEALRQEVATSRATVAADVQRDILARVQAKYSELRAAGSSIDNVGNRIAITQQRERAVATDTAQQLNKLQTLNTDLSSIAVHVRNAGAEVSEGTRDTVSSATAINNCALRTKSSGDAMETAATNLLA